MFLLFFLIVILCLNASYTHAIYAISNNFDKKRTNFVLHIVTKMVS